jgi:Ca-activated chloride channel family protein
VPAVSLNVGVLDDQGDFALDLQQSEIVLHDNGVEQELLDFTRSEAPLRVAVLLDHSGSMGNKMGETIDALVEFLQRLEPEDQVKLMGFNHSVTSYTPFTTQHAMVGRLAQGIQAEGGTALYDALLYAYRQLEPFDMARERRVIFLLTDGKDRESRTSAEPALELVRAGGVTVFALGQGEALRDQDLRDVIQEITRVTGGDAYFESDRGRLRQSFTEIAQAMRALYFVSYRPSDSAPGWHEITMEIARPGLRARHKPGYQRDQEGQR